MSMQERSYSGKLFRPTPEIHIEEDGSLGVIVTPWGGRQGAKRVIETLQEFILSSQNDMEATSPFAKMTCLSPLANTLRVAIMLANDTLSREENRNEYTCGVELLVFAQKANEVAWAQVGHPDIYLQRSGLNLMPIGVHLDLATELGPDKKLAPLPSTLLGLNQTSNFSLNSFRPMAGDHFIFLSRSHTPAAFVNLKPKKINLDSMTEALAKDAPDTPFWLGHYEIPVRAE